MLTDKIQPQNLEAEQAVLGAMLLDNAKISKVTEVLDSSCFHSGNHKIIFEVIISLPVADLITVTNKLKEAGQLDQVGGAAYLVELYNAVITAEHVIEHAKIVKEKSVRRKIINDATALLNSAEEGDLKELAEKTESISSNIRESSSETEPSAMDLKELINSDYPSVEYFIPGVLPKRGKLIISASMNSCKTFLAQNLALSLTGGKARFLNKFNVEPAKTYYLDLESGYSALKDRFKPMVETENLEVSDFRIKYRPYINLLDIKWQIWLENEMSKFKSQVLIIDATNEIWEGDENSDKEVRALCRYLDDLKDNFNLSIVLIQHWRKKTKGFTSGAEMTSGSKKWLGFAEFMISLEGDANSITIRCDKAKNCPKFDPFILKLNPDSLWLEFVTDFKQKYSEETLIALFARVDNANSGRVRLSELKKRAKVDKSCSNNTLTKLIAESSSFERKEVLKGKKKEVWIVKKSDLSVTDAESSEIEDLL